MTPLKESSVDVYGNPVIGWADLEIKTLLVAVFKIGWLQYTVPVYTTLPDRTEDKRYGIGLFNHKYSLFQRENDFWLRVSELDYKNVNVKLLPDKHDSVENKLVAGTGLTRDSDKVHLVANRKIIFQLPDQRKGEAYVEEKYRDILIESLVTNDISILSVTEIN